MDEPESRRLLIGVAGPCGSGKSTLIAGLELEGYICRQIAQEHSYVPYMWERITNPDILVFLNATFSVCTLRRRLNWTNEDYKEQLRRLAHAHQHADLIIETDNISPAQVLARVVEFLSSRS